MCAAATIGIHNDFTPGEAGVAVRATNHKPAGGIYKIFYLLIEKFLYPLRIFCLYARNQNIDDILPDFGLHGLVFIKLVMLR